MQYWGITLNENNQMSITGAVWVNMRRSGPLDQPITVRDSVHDLARTNGK